MAGHEAIGHGRRYAFRGVLCAGDIGSGSGSPTVWADGQLRVLAEGDIWANMTGCGTVRFIHAGGDLHGMILPGGDIERISVFGDMDEVDINASSSIGTIEVRGRINGSIRAAGDIKSITSRGSAGMTVESANGDVWRVVSYGDIEGFVGYGRIRSVVAWGDLNATMDAGGGIDELRAGGRITGEAYVPGPGFVPLTDVAERFVEDDKTLFGYYPGADPFT